MVRHENTNDEVADFVAWLEGSEGATPAPKPEVNTDPLQARVPVARPELTQAVVDRWMDGYEPEWEWQDDAATDAQLGYLRSLLRRQSLFLSGEDAASITKGMASHMIELLAEGSS